MIDNSAEFAALMKRAKSGSHEAVGLLIESVRTYLLLVANEEIEPQMKQKLGASDAVQDVCMFATERFENFRGTTRAEFRAWLRQSLLHRIADSRRRYDGSQKRQVAREVDLDEGVVMEDSRLSPHTSMIAREESVRLMSAMQRLPEDYRVVLRLRNWDLLSFDEIGKQLDRSCDAAQKLWTRAVKRLEQELNKQNP